jgi:AraC family transcriptional regulator of adaptative response/methylated-DNA-[protein]-cysteine methyltransferase
MARQARPSPRPRNGRPVSYTVADSPLGRVLLAGTERGVCCVCLAAADDALEAALAERCPGRDVRRADGRLRPWLKPLLEHLRGRRPALDLPLDVGGTAFQRRVWEELCRIPYGATRTYAEVARAVGRPAAVRAVAGACAANPVAILVPCHRVVRSDGGLGGYYWGLDYKVRLLEHERNGRPGARSGRPACAVRTDPVALAEQAALAAPARSEGRGRRVISVRRPGR